jgi:hypothetical protein
MIIGHTGVPHLMWTLHWNNFHELFVIQVSVLKT